MVDKRESSVERQESIYTKGGRAESRDNSVTS